LPSLAGAGVLPGERAIAQQRLDPCPLASPRDVREDPYEVSSEERKWAGRGLFVVGTVADLISIVQAEDKVRQTVVVASGFAGMWIGVKVGGLGGGAIGSVIEPGGGTAVGGFFGGIAGGAPGSSVFAGPGRSTIRS